MRPRGSAAMSAPSWCRPTPAACPARASGTPASGDQQVERVESLTGAPRSTFRRNEEVVTFLPESRVVRTEKRESLGLFPDLLSRAKPRSPSSTRRAAGRRPGRRLRGRRGAARAAATTCGSATGSGARRRAGWWSSCRPWTTDGQRAGAGRLLRTPARCAGAHRQAGPDDGPPAGWRVERAEAVKTTAGAEGWDLKAPVAGFKPMSCYRRPAAGAPEGVHAVDFLGWAGLGVAVRRAYDRQRHVQEGVFASGATQTLTRRIQDWWLTAVGEVPRRRSRPSPRTLSGASKPPHLGEAGFAPGPARTICRFSVLSL